MLDTTEPQRTANDNHTRTLTEILDWIERGNVFEASIRQFIKRVRDTPRASVVRALKSIVQTADCPRVELGVDGLKLAIKIIIIEEGGDDRTVEYIQALALRDPSICHYVGKGVPR